jgi:hypothetical protein
MYGKPSKAGSLSSSCGWVIGQDELRFGIPVFIDARSYLLACIRSPESKTPPGIRRLQARMIEQLPQVTKGRAQQAEEMAPFPPEGVSSLFFFSMRKS